MRRRHLDVLDSYELTGSPVVTSKRLAYVPWIDDAVRPYNATRLPIGPAQGLWDALQRARLSAVAATPPVEAA